MKMTDEQDGPHDWKARRASVQSELDPLLKTGLQPQLYQTLSVSMFGLKKSLPISDIMTA